MNGKKSVGKTGGDDIGRSCPTTCREEKGIQPCLVENGTKRREVYPMGKSVPLRRRTSPRTRDLLDCGLNRSSHNRTYTDRSITGCSMTWKRRRCIERSLQPRQRYLMFQVLWRAPRGTEHGRHCADLGGRM